MPADVIVCSNLSFAWPDGTPVLTGLDATFGPGATGLVGVNGSGKSTLLRLIAGQLRPTSGTLGVAGAVGYLPQDVTLQADQTVAELLGVATARDALARIERGEVSEAAFAAVGDDWDAEDMARAELHRLGLGRLGLDDPVGRLSGGETILLAVAAVFLRRPEVILLDEPTNNLDLEARARLYAAVRSWPGVLVAVSHDRELLALMDQIADLSDGKLRLYGGNFVAYQAQLAAEQRAARQAVSAARTQVRQERQDLLQAQVKQARRDRQGRKAAASGMPPVIAHARKQHAERTAGRSRELHEQRLARAREHLVTAQDAVREDPEIRVLLPATAVPAGRTVLAMTGLADPRWHPAAAAWRPGPGTLDELIVRGPERIALTGRNGTGKTTLLRAAAGLARPGGLTVRRGTAGVGYLPQRLDILVDSLTVAGNVRAAAPDTSDNEVRAGLARFLLRGEQADRLAGTLSGGERFRAVLAALLLAQPPPQLLLLDEPTNNLDLASVRQLTAALDGYRGAIIAASHDLPFLRSIGPTRWLRLDMGSGLTVQAGP